MRVITVKQPWAWAIVNGGKDVENRVRNLAGQYRGPLAIHAGKTIADLTPEQEALLSGCEGLDDWFGGEDILGGAIIGVVNLRATHHAEFCAEADEHGELCTPWAETDVWHLELEDPQALAQSIPFKGALGMRTLPDEIIGQIYRQGFSTRPEAA